ncbi:MAG: translation initiation factor IF-2 [Euryarchaeota archaeon]|nr:translation initiation factor IF-2 [Euryarchaeota archaeon]MDE1835429.1 translation initiation factor IF-2 [Euryarchaeota archaeon]MDE1879565.1 translation initiation factor IF-2 [Euryarchaeota archaeon]MDE2046080.1 translation initiation factor IF-2 [Thermoplasmata archaeon]
MSLRQPIVSMMGHVDHGKTTLLDKIAGSAKASKEAGGITQHIGAVEVPLKVIEKVCAGLLREEQFSIPGLLFIDTPGHRSFVTMRRRGGALADIAIVVIDVREGVMPQTREVLQILRHEKTPFIIAANKVDTIQGWRTPPARTPLPAFLATLPTDTQKAIDTRIYSLSEMLDQLGFSAERYDRVSDYTRNVAIVPVSAKTGAGIPDLLAVMVGLSQRFLEEELRQEERPGEATVLERTEERGIGPVANVIVYQGRMKVGDPIVVTGTDGPFVSKIRVLTRPVVVRAGRGTPSRRMEPLTEAVAASGVQLSAPEIEKALPGGLIKVITASGGEAAAERAREELESETYPVAAVEENGVWLKADTLGGLEALAFECKEARIPIKGAEVGAVTKRDVLVMKAVKDPLSRAVLAFAVPVHPEAAATLPGADVRVFSGEVMYRLLEEYQEWKGKRQIELEQERRKALVHPAKFQVLPGFVFHRSHPAIVGVKVLAGTLRPPSRLMAKDGTDVGLLRGLQDKGDSLKEGEEGAEIAASIEGATVGRSFNEGDTLYVAISEEGARALARVELRPSEREVFDEVLQIRRSKEPFWGK